MNSAISGFLADTPVLTLSGYRPISSIIVGDTIISADGHTDTVKEIKTYKRIACAETIPYVIPKGMFGAKTDIYLSPIQRIVVGSSEIYREVKSIEGINRATMGEDSPIEYYNIRLASKNEYAIVAGGIGAEPLPANERIEISAEDFRRIIRDRYGSRPEESVMAAIFKLCKKMPNGMIQIPMLMFNTVSLED